ncbi:MAG: hypothetical protein SCK70_00550 [bacterium]|nr:hypothetical protein [bacterium]
MKKCYALILILLFCAALLNAQQQPIQRPHLIKLSLNAEEFQSLVAIKFQFATKLVKDTAFVIVSDTELDFLKERGFPSLALWRAGHF